MPGVEDAAIFRSTDGGENWQRTFRPARPRHRPEVATGRGRHVPAHDHSRSQQSETNVHRDFGRGRVSHDDGGKTWKPINNGLYSKYIPNPTAEVGHCVHHVAMNPKRPDVLFMQKHWDVMRSDDAGDNWTKISGNLPTDFGFVIDVHAHEPETIYVVPIKSDSEHYVHEGKLRVYPQPQRRQRVGAAHQGPAAKRLLRQRAARRHVLSTLWTIAEFISERPADRFTARPMQEIQLGSDRARPAGGAVGGSADAAVSPFHSSPEKCFLT